MASTPTVRCGDCGMHVSSMTRHKSRPVYAQSTYAKGRRSVHPNVCHRTQVDDYIASRKREAALSGLTSVGVWSQCISNTDAPVTLVPVALASIELDTYEPLRYTYARWVPDWVIEVAKYKRFKSLDRARTIQVMLGLSKYVPERKGLAYQAQFQLSTLSGRLQLVGEIINDLCIARITRQAL